MAEPTPIFVTPSTTLVQVTTLQTPYTPVIANAYAYAGQVVTILDGTSSFGVLASSIVVSTAATSQFADGSISTLINQPQGFVTLQSQTPNTWSFLNSFPFRNQYVSAGLLTLNTSTLQVAVLSTLQEYTSSLRVENLLVSGNFSQSSPITINQTLSTFGSVELYSSFSAYGNTFFSSGLTLQGAGTLGSSLTLLGSLTTPSTIRLLSTMYVSGSVFALGSLSTSLLNLSGNLVTYGLQVRGSTLTDVNVAGSLQVTQLNALSSLFSGANLEAYQTFSGQFSTLSSMAITDSLAVTSTATIGGQLSTQGALVVKGTLSTGTDTLVQGPLQGSSHLFLGGFFTLSTNVSTLDFQAQSAFVQKNLRVDPFLTNVTRAEHLEVGQHLGIGDFLTASTLIGGMLSTSASAAVSGSLFGESSFTSQLQLSTLSSFSTLGDLYVLGSVSTLSDFNISASLRVYKDLQVASTSFWNQSNLSSSYIQGDLRILGNLQVTQTLTLSSIVLPSSVLANNFQVSTLFVGYRGYASATGISTLFASSIATGGLEGALKTMDMANHFVTYNLSSFLLSSLELKAAAEGGLAPSTLFQTLSSLGVNTIAQQNRLEGNTLAYSLCNLYAAKQISTKTLTGSNIMGLLFGDATQLLNVQFPARLSTGVVQVSSILSETLVARTTIASTLEAAAFNNWSTLKINSLTLFGNAQTSLPVTLQSNYIAAPYAPSNLLTMYPLSMYGDQTGVAFKQVLVNSNLLPNFPQNTYTLGVGNTLRLNNISSPLFLLPLDEYRGDILVTQQSGSLSVQSIYVSSGLIGLSSGSLFLPETTSLTTISTNRIQPFLSTLVFNSTLFVKRDTENVGINTFPTYALDVKGTTYAFSNVLSKTSTLVRDQIVSRQPPTSLWYGVGCNSTGVSSNLRYSVDGETWFADINTSDPFLTCCNVAYDGGVPSVDTSNLPQGMKTWVATGGIGVLYKTDESQWLPAVVQQTTKKSALTNVAFNGSYWVMTSYNVYQVTFTPAYTTILTSTDGQNWSDSRTGGFEWDGVSSNYGGFGIAWNGSLWIAVGHGSSPINTLLNSSDGSNWSNSTSGGFSSKGYGIVWTGCNWVAVGESGTGTSFVTSSNGLEWITPAYGFSVAGKAIAWNGSRLVAVGNYDVGYPSILYSDTYGATWQAATGTLFDTAGAEGRCVTWNGSYWLAGGTTGIRKSTDGITWFQPAASPSYLFAGLAWSSNALPSMMIGFSTLRSFSTITTTTLNVAVGEDALNSNYTIATSSNGISWSIANSGQFGGSGRGVAYNGSNLWVAAGNGITTSNLLFSANGADWSNIYLLSVVNMGVGNAVTYGAGSNSNYWASAHSIVSSGDPTQFYSTDGSNWYASGGSQFSVAAHGIAVNTTGMFLCVGDNGGSGNPIRVGSTSPTSWFIPSSNNFFDTAGYGITFGAGLWVSVGSDSGGNTIKYTSDYVLFSNASGSLFSVAGYGVAYDGTGKWVAVGDSGGSGGTIKYSTDASTWSAATSGEFTGVGRGVFYNKGLSLWIATGSTDGTTAVKYSGDGENWSNATGGEFQAFGFGVAGTSNTSVSLQSYKEQVQFIKNPGPNVMARQVTPYVAYTSTLLDLNNVVLFDRQANCILGTSSISQFTSTFYETGTTNVSGYVSTQRMVLQAGFYLGIQNV